MFNPMMMRGMASLGGVKPLQVFMVNGQPMALVECSGSDVYCNALEDPDWGVLDEGANGPAAWHPTYNIPEPFTADTWMTNVGNNIYTAR